MVYIRFFILVCCVFFCGSMLSYFPINVFRPYDINLRPPKWQCGTWQVTSYVEGGYKSRSVNGLRSESNVLRIWQEREDSISMLKGFDDSSPMSILLNDINAAVSGTLEENGTRGHFQLTGDFKFTAGFGFLTRYHFFHNFSLGVYIPFFSMRLKNIQFRDLTSESTLNDNDVVVKDMLTDPFFKKVAEFDPSLDLCNGWDRIGIGDVTVLAEWARNFPQPKQVLKNVALDVRVGLSLPTGFKKDEDELLAIPFGNDGAAGLIVGSGIQITWFDRIRGGVDFEILHLFGNTRTRRIKTHEDQTDFFLLAKEKTHKDFGFTQRYNLFLEFNPIVCGLSASAVYQFFKHSKDTLALCSTRFSNIAANTAESLKEWTMHHVIFKVAYDFQHIVKEGSGFKPQIMAFYKLPFNGKRALLVNTAGLAFTLNF